jgi:photosystem II stability/assembly factor-like uncharacterized protein
MLKFILNFIIVLCCFSTNCFADKAGTNPWIFAGWYGGGNYPSIAVDPNSRGRLFLSSDVAGIWRSNDFGEHWSFVNDGVINLNNTFLTVAPSDPNVIYAASPAGLMRSGDGGLSWKELPSGNRKIGLKKAGAYHPICIDHQDANKVYIGTGTGEVLFSTNSGQKWQNLGDIAIPFGREVPISALQITPDGKKIFVASELGLICFEWSTQRWKKFDLSLKLRGISDLQISKSGVLFAASDRMVAISRDEGRSWKYTNDVPDGKIGGLAVASDKDGKIKILVGWAKGFIGGVFSSQDLGQTWTNIVHNNLNYDLSGNPTRAWMRNFQRPSSVQIDPFEISTFYYTDTWGVWRSDDNGKSWNEKIRGAPNTTGSDLIVSPNGWVYVAAMDQGLLVSKDGGCNYKPVLPNSQLRSGRHDWRVLVLDSKSAGPGIVVTDFPWDQQVNQVLTQDQKGRWQKFNLGKPRKNTLWGQGYARALAVSAADHQDLYLGMDGDDGGGLFISKDAGRTWSRSEGQPDSLRIYHALAVDPTNPNRIFWGSCGKNGGVYRSEDKGKTWQHVRLNCGCIFDMAITPNGIVYASGTAQGAVLYVSDSHGNDWSLLKRFDKASGVCEAITFDHRDTKRIFAGVVGWMENPIGRIYSSIDSGKTWKSISEGLPINSGPVAMAIDSKNDYLYVLLYAGGVYKRSLKSLRESQVR